VITTDRLCREIAGLQTADLLRWIENAWVQPEGEPGRYLFQQIDVARVRLIVELRDELRVDEEVLPVVLSLLDQLHETRRQMRRLHTAINEAAPEDVKHRILERLIGAARELRGDR